MSDSPAIDAMETVRAAAERLLADLDRADRSTCGWTNEALADALVTAAMDSALTKLSSTRLWGKDNRLPSSEFWRIAGPRLQCGIMQLRARTKPRGYAGDFETLLLFDQHYECNHPLGKVFDRYFQRQAAVEAVRARTAQIAGWIAEHALANPADSFRIASIGCGPALDIQQTICLLPQPHRRRLQIQLFDLDEAALAHSESTIAPLLAAGQLTTHRENLYRLGQRPTHAKLLQPADFIFCAGLFDYLEEEPAAALLAFLWQQLRPDGKLIVGNFCPTNPTRAYMEWIGNWYLLYRTSAQLAVLAAMAGLPASQCSIATDRTGVQLLLVGKRV